MDGELGQISLEGLLSQAPIPLVAADKSGRLTYYSPSLQRLTGRPFRALGRDELIREHALFACDGVTPLRPGDVPLLRALRGEVVSDALIAARAVNGHLLFLRCHASPIRDEAGHVVGAVALVQDVTAEQVAQRDHDELRRRLVETINHELRTPLAKVVGHAELLHDIRADLPGTAARSVEVLSRSAEDMVRLAGMVSDLADLDESHTRLVKTTGDIAELVRDVVDRFAAAAAERGLQLHSRAPAGLVATMDRGQVGRALGALLDNAIRYAPPSTGITVSLDALEDGVELSVADEGAGIPERDRERLIRPFERGRGSHPPVSSKGLGLALAHTIAAAHGGEMGFARLVSGGFQVNLCIPQPPAG